MTKLADLLVVGVTARILVNRIPFLLLLVAVPLAVGQHASAHDLPSFGQLPTPGPNWKLHKDGRRGGTSQWSWVVLRDSDSGDLLSFAAHVLEPGERPEVIYSSDTAHELFPGGYCSLATDTKEQFTVWPLRNTVVKLHLVLVDQGKNLSREALEYTTVQEAEKVGGNRLAHGYVLIFNGISVFVQHTSKRPITFELAHDMAVELISIHFKKASGSNKVLREQ